MADGGTVESQARGVTASAKMARQVWRQARLAFKQRDYETAAAEIKGLIDLCDDNAIPVSASELRCFLGVTLLRLRRNDEGVEQLLNAVAIEPTSARAHYKLGLGYGRLRRQEDALAQFLHALQLDPDNPEFLCRLGLQYRRLGFEAKAEVLYTRALEIEPGRPEAVAALQDLGTRTTPHVGAANREIIAAYAPVAQAV